MLTLGQTCLHCLWDARMFNENVDLSMILFPLSSKISQVHPKWGLLTFTRSPNISKGHPKRSLLNENVYITRGNLTSATKISTYKGKRSDSSENLTCPMTMPPFEQKALTLSWKILHVQFKCWHSGENVYTSLILSHVKWKWRRWKRKCNTVSENLTCSMKMSTCKPNRLHFLGNTFLLS